MLRNFGSWIAGVLFLLLVYYVILAVPLAMRDTPQLDGNSPQDLGAIGEYFGYLVGVPVAIGGALAAVLIALNTDQVAKRQLMLEAAKYRDQKTDEIKANIREFAMRLQAVRAIGDQLSRRISRLRPGANSTTALIEAAVGDESVIESHQALTVAFDELSRAILALASNEVVHACVEGQRSSTQNKIRSAIEAFWGKNEKFHFERSILDIRDRIEFLQQDRTVEDAAAAMMLMPADFHSVDFLGAYIKIADRNDRLATDLLKEQRLKVGDELLNYGLALLASLYQLLPSDSMISETIGRLYDIKDLKMRPTARFKAREIFFSRSTVEVVNQAIDGHRLFLKVKRPDVVSAGSIEFDDSAGPSGAGRAAQIVRASVEQIGEFMFRRDRAA